MIYLELYMLNVNCLLPRYEMPKNNISALDIIKLVIFVCYPSDQCISCTRLACLRRHFPLALGYAITGHASQGCTISSIAGVHISNSFAPGLSYVILSRVTKRSNLRLFTPLKAEDCVPIQLPEVNHSSIICLCYVICKWATARKVHAAPDSY